MYAYIPALHSVSGPKGTCRDWWCVCLYMHARTYVPMQEVNKITQTPNSIQSIISFAFSNIYGSFSTSVKPSPTNPELYVVRYWTIRHDGRPPG